MFKYSKKSAFIRREREMNFIYAWLKEDPENTLFIYGPKSSGKTTMLYKIADELQGQKKSLVKKEYDIRYFNLREFLITNYKDFIRIFFQVGKEEEGIKEKREYNLHVFKLTVEEYKGIDKASIDPFKLLKEKLKKINKRGIRPVIIIDELQALESIYMNGQKELIKELFNFFVAITKESHLAHIIIGSSDGYFIEQIYNDSKLRKTSAFLKVDYLNKEQTLYWLNNLEKESAIENFQLTKKQIEEIWDNFGGSGFEISRLLGDLLMRRKNGGVSMEDFCEIVEYKLIEKSSLYEMYIKDKKTIALVKGLSELIADHKIFKIGQLYQIVKKDYPELNELQKACRKLVQDNYLAYDPVTSEYELQGPSMEKGLIRAIKELKKQGLIV